MDFDEFGDLARGSTAPAASAKASLRNDEINAGKEISSRVSLNRPKTKGTTSSDINELNSTLRNERMLLGKGEQMRHPSSPIMGYNIVDYIDEDDPYASAVENFKAVVDKWSNKERDPIQNSNNNNKQSKASKAINIYTQNTSAIILQQKKAKSGSGTPKSGTREGVKASAGSKATTSTTLSTNDNGNSIEISAKNSDVYGGESVDETSALIPDRQQSLCSDAGGTIVSEIIVANRPGNSLASTAVNSGRPLTTDRQTRNDKGDKGSGNGASGKDNNKDIMLSLAAAYGLVPKSLIDSSNKKDSKASKASSSNPPANPGDENPPSRSSSREEKPSKPEQRSNASSTTERDSVKVKEKERSVRTPAADKSSGTERIELFSVTTAVKEGPAASSTSVPSNRSDSGYSSNSVKPNQLGGSFFSASEKTSNNSSGANAVREGFNGHINPAMSEYGGKPSSAVGKSRRPTSSSSVSTSSTANNNVSSSIQQKSNTSGVYSADVSSRDRAQPALRLEEVSSSSNLFAPSQPSSNSQQNSSASVRRKLSANSTQNRIKPSSTQAIRDTISDDNSDYMPDFEPDLTTSVVIAEEDRRGSELERDKDDSNLNARNGTSNAFNGSNIGKEINNKLRPSDSEASIEYLDINPKTSVNSNATGIRPISNLNSKNSNSLGEKLIGKKPNQPPIHSDAEFDLIHSNYTGSFENDINDVPSGLHASRPIESTSTRAVPSDVLIRDPPRTAAESTPREHINLIAEATKLERPQSRKLYLGSDNRSPRPTSNRNKSADSTKVKSKSTKSSYEDGGEQAVKRTTSFNGYGDSNNLHRPPSRQKTAFPVNLSDNAQELEKGGLLDRMQRSRIKTSGAYKSNSFGDGAYIANARDLGPKMSQTAPSSENRHQKSLDGTEPPSEGLIVGDYREGIGRSASSAFSHDPIADGFAALNVGLTESPSFSIEINYDPVSSFGSRQPTKPVSKPSFSGKRPGIADNYVETSSSNFSNGKGINSNPQRSDSTNENGPKSGRSNYSSSFYIDADDGNDVDDHKRHEIDRKIDTASHVNGSSRWKNEIKASDNNTGSKEARYEDWGDLDAKRMGRRGYQSPYRGPDSGDKFNNTSSGLDKGNLNVSPYSDTWEYLDDGDEGVFIDENGSDDDYDPHGSMNTLILESRLGEDFLSLFAPQPEP